jgi:hypothetical protein
MQCIRDKVRMTQGRLQFDPDIVGMGHLSELVGAFLSELRSRLCGMLGLSAYSATAWQALLGANSFVEGLEGMDGQQMGSDSDSDDGSSSLCVEQCAAAAAAAGADLARCLTSGWGSGCSSSSGGGGGDSRHRGQWHLPQDVRMMQLIVGRIIGGLPPSTRQDAEQCRQEAEAVIPKAAVKLR